MGKIRRLAASLTHVLLLSVLALAFFKTETPGGVDQTPTRPIKALKTPAPPPVQQPTPVDPKPARVDEMASAEKTAADRKATEADPIVQPVALQDKTQLLDRLVSAYPDFLSGHDGSTILWLDGERMTFDDGRAKTPGERLELPDIEDQFFDAYPVGRNGLNPPPDFDPGRVRYEPFFQKMYGNCKTGDVDKLMGEVIWLPKNFGRRISVTTVNGLDKQLQQVSEELDDLPAEFMKYLRPIAGVYNCRAIAGTARASMHAYAAAIDINTDYGDYWQNSKASRGVYPYKNRVPWEIVEIFEKHGFIWGGKWSHYDTFHFEYRPELLPDFKPMADQISPPPRSPEKPVVTRPQEPKPAPAEKEPGGVPNEAVDALPLPVRQPRDLR